MNKVLRPLLPDESLVPAPGPEGKIERKYVHQSDIRADQHHRLKDERLKTNEGEKIYCYWTERGWVPELYTEETPDETRRRVAEMIDGVIERNDEMGQFFRDTDGSYVLEALGDNGTGHFPPRRNPGHNAVPVLHDSETPAYGRYPYLAETEGRMRVFKVLSDQNTGRLEDDDNVLKPVKPSKRWNPEKINEETMPFDSVPTDAMTVATTGSDKWGAQVMPHGKLSLYPWATQLHYSNGFITGIVAYEKETAKEGKEETLVEFEVVEKNGDILVLDLDGHLQRAEDNAKVLGFKGLTKEFLREMLMAQLEADRRWIPKQGNKAENRYYIRFTGFPNATGPKLAGPEQMLMLVGTPIGPYKVKKQEQLKVGLLGPRPVNPTLGTTKNVTNYQGPVTKFLELAGKAKKQSDKELHEALFVKEDGTPQEGTSSNIFFVRTDKERRSTLFSPNPEKANVLPGRTVQLTMAIARHLGWNVVGYDHEKLDMEALIEEAKAGAVQMGMTGTAMGIRQIQELVREEDDQVESITINGNTYSPEMQALQDIYEKILTGEHELASQFMQVAVGGSAVNKNMKEAA